MTHLFEQIYGNNVSFEVITAYQVVDTIFVYSLHKKELGRMRKELEETC